jgi:hypothetical protein
MSTMSGDGADRIATLGTIADKHFSALRRASDMLAQVKPKADRGFKKSIDDAIAVVEAEWKAQREHELAEKHRLEAARQRALMVREIMILPLLNDLSADFAAEQKKVLSNWQIESGGDADVVYGIASTPTVNDGGPSCFIIKASVSVVEQGATLNLAVECSCVDAQNLATGKIRQVIEKTKAMPMAKFEELGSQVWYHDQLKECVRMCVLTRLRHIARPDPQPVSQPAPSL